MIRGTLHSRSYTSWAVAYPSRPCNLHIYSFGMFIWYWIGSKYCHRQTNSFDIHCQSCSNHRNSTEFWVETFNHWWQLLTFATHVFVTRMNGINILKIVNIDRQSREFFFRALLICSQRKFDVIDECHQYILSNMQKQIIVWCMSTYPFHHGVCCGPPKPGNPKPNALKNGSVKNGVLWNGVLWNGVNGVSWMTTESSSELSGAAASCPCMWTSTSCGPLPSVPLIASTIWICWCSKSLQTMIELAMNGIYIGQNRLFDFQKWHLTCAKCD